MIVPLVVGNWKMNGSQPDCLGLARQIVRRLKTKPCPAEVAIAPPFTVLALVAKIMVRSKVELCAQNSHWAENGAFTGEISAPMLSEIGCRYVLLGHSERRHIFHESNVMIAHKIESVVTHGMRAILCVGETLSERRRNKTHAVVAGQLDAALKGIAKGVIDNLEIAYEPVWAIGTGHNPTPEQIRNVHDFVREFLQNTFGGPKGKTVRILYGGSVNPENALALANIDEVNGLLVGGASLKADSFLAIVRAFTKT